VPPDPARKRLAETIFDPKAIAALFSTAIGGILFLLFPVFKIWDILPDWLKSQAKTEQQRTPIQLALAAIIAFLLWIFLAILIFLWERWQERRRHLDGRPKPGKTVIYVAELQGDDKKGSHRNHILLSLRRELGDSVQVLRAGIGLHAEEMGNPEDDAHIANRKGQKYLNQGKHKGDLLIWGQILAEKKLVELRFTSRAHDAAEQKRFAFDEKMLLAPDFGPELATALAAIAAQLALPAFNPGNFVADVLIPVAEKLGNIIANLPTAMTPEQRGLLLLSYAVAERSIGEQSGNSDALLRAISAYRSALKELTQEKVPLDWAKTQNNLGTALVILGERDSGMEQLDAAIAAFREALKERTQEKVPLDWAMTQNNLGAALQTLGERESGTEGLEAAVKAYREALKEFTREKVSLDWAMTQNNLGAALQALGERESGIERLEAAVAAYQEALKEYTRERVPLLWATTQNNLGTAFRRLDEQESGTEQLEAAVAAYSEALKEWTREKVPLDWAMAQNNLGNALWALSARESGIERLEDAAAAYREALKEWTQEKVPLYWAKAQNNLGNALRALGERENGMESLVAAVTAYREALKERKRERVPLQWAMTQNNLGYAFESMGELEDANESYRLALQVFTHENHAPNHKMVSDNLARVLEKLRAETETE
jgi:tetratricopeptide (TPR) repeat protein